MKKNIILEFQRELEAVSAKDNGIVFKVLPYEELIGKAEYLYEAIKNVTSGNRKFTIPEIERYLSELKFHNLRYLNFRKKLKMNMERKPI